MEDNKMRRLLHYSNQLQLRQQIMLLYASGAEPRNVESLGMDIQVWTTSRSGHAVPHALR